VSAAVDAQNPDDAESERRDCQGWKASRVVSAWSLSAQVAEPCAARLLRQRQLDHSINAGSFYDTFVKSNELCSELTGAVGTVVLRLHITGQSACVLPLMASSQMHALVGRAPHCGPCDRGGGAVLRRRRALDRGCK
jgi:hypothetical protein